MNLWKKIKSALWAILGLLAAFLLFLRRKEPPEVEEARKTVTEAKKTAGEIVREKAEREKKAVELKNRLKKITTGTLILVFLICTPATARDIYIPEDYDELVEYYLAAVEVALEYQRLYEAAETDIDRLLEENQKLSEQLELMIEYNRKRRLGLTAGAIVSSTPGLFIGLTLQL